MAINTVHEQLTIPHWMMECNLCLDANAIHKYSIGDSTGHIAAIPSSPALFPDVLNSHKLHTCIIAEVYFRWTSIIAGVSRYIFHKFENRDMVAPSITR